MQQEENRQESILQCCDAICCKNCWLYGGIYVLVSVVCFCIGAVLIHSVLGAILAMLIPGCTVLYLLYKKFEPIIHHKLMLVWGVDMVFFIICWQIFSALLFIVIGLAVGPHIMRIIGGNSDGSEGGCHVKGYYFPVFLLNAFILAALVEEGMKYFLARHASRSPYIVSRKCLPIYAVAFCMFFGMYENILYISMAGGSTAAYVIGLVRCVMPLHPFWGCMSAAYHEQARYLKGVAPSWFACTWRSMLLHGLFDFAAFSQAYLASNGCGAAATPFLFVSIGVIAASFIMLRKAVLPLLGEDTYNVHTLIQNGNLPEPLFWCGCWCCTRASFNNGPADLPVGQQNIPNPNNNSQYVQMPNNSEAQPANNSVEMPNQYPQFGQPYAAAPQQFPYGAQVNPAPQYAVPVGQQGSQPQYGAPVGQPYPPQGTYASPPPPQYSTSGV